MQRLAGCVGADTAGHAELFAMPPQHDSTDPGRCAEHAGIQNAAEQRHVDLSPALTSKHHMLAGSAQLYLTAAPEAEQASEHHACSCALSCTAVAASGLPRIAAAAAADVEKGRSQSAAAVCRPVAAAAVAVAAVAAAATSAVSVAKQQSDGLGLI